MKKIVKVFVGVLFVVALMFAEYRIIMTNIEPVILGDHYIGIRLFGFEDRYRCNVLVPILESDTVTVMH